MGAQALDPVDSLIAWRYGYQADSMIDAGGLVCQDVFVGELDGGLFTARQLCTAAILGNFTKNITLPHGRFNSGEVRIAFKHASPVNALRRGNNYLIRCGLTNNDAVCIGNERNANLGRHSRVFLYERDGWLGGKGDSVTNGATGRLKLCRIDGNVLKIQWRNDCSGFCGSYQLREVKISYRVWERKFS